MAKKNPDETPLPDRVRRVIGLMQGLEVKLSDVMLMQIVATRLKNPDDPIHKRFVPSDDEPAMPSIDQVFHRVLAIQPHKPEEQRSLMRESHMLIAGTLAADVDLAVLGDRAEEELEQLLDNLDADQPEEPATPTQP